MGGVFDVFVDGERKNGCIIRGVCKRARDIFVGDYCELQDNIITQLYDRKNVLIRPYVANIDCLAIVVSPVPQPDWSCVEKLILNCHQQKITPIILLNKCDMLSLEEREKFLLPYKEDFVTMELSAFSGEGIEKLREFIKGKLICFAGQSAVGKSSLINALGKNDLLVGELSKKIARGKNTTRHVEIYELAEGRVVDTCGFSVSEHIDIKAEELTYYYDEFISLQNNCRYNNCTHISEPSCAVKQAVADGKINSARYSRYVTLFKSLKESQKKKYD